MIFQGLAFALSVLCLPWVPSTLYDWLSCPEHLQRTLCPHTGDTSPKFPIPAERVKRVAIIGAGSGGLATLKTFMHDIPKPDGQRWEIELLEQRSGLGGIWSAQRRDPGLILTGLFYNRLQDDNSARYPYLPETPLYPQLRTNTPAPTSDHKFAH